MLPVNSGGHTAYQTFVLEKCSRTSVRVRSLMHPP